MGVRTFVATERRAIRLSILWLHVAIFFPGCPLPCEATPPPSPAASLKWLGGIAAAPSFLIIRVPVRRCCYQYICWIAREGPHEVQLLPLACAFVRTCYKDMYG